MQSKQGVTLSTLGYSVDCLKSVYNYYSTGGRFFQVNNSIISVITDILEIVYYNGNFRAQKKPSQNGRGKAIV